MDANSPGQAFGHHTAFGPHISFDPLFEEKDLLTRSILVFDISQLAAGTVLSAALTMEVMTIAADTAARVSRSGRASTWAEVTVTWNTYEAASLWTVAGGEIDHFTPAAVPFIFPGATGPYTFPDLSAHAQDAIDNRAGFMSIILNLLDEENTPDRGITFATTEHPDLPEAQLVVVLQT